MSPPNLVVDGYNRSTGDDAAAVITAFVTATAPVTTGTPVPADY